MHKPSIYPGSIEATKITIGAAGLVITGITATGIPGILIGGGIAGAILLAGGGIAYVVIQSKAKTA